MAKGFDVEAFWERQFEQSAKYASMLRALQVAERERDAARAEAARLREALGILLDEEPVDVYCECIYCHAHREFGHSEDHWETCEWRRAKERAALSQTSPHSGDGSAVGSGSLAAADMASAVTEPRE